MSYNRNIPDDASAIELGSYTPSQFSDSVSDHVGRAQRQTMSMSGFLSELHDREALSLDGSAALPPAQLHVDLAQSAAPAAANTMATHVAASPDAPYVANIAEPVSDNEILLRPRDENDAAQEATDSLGLVVAVGVSDPVPALAACSPECLDVLFCICCCPCQVLGGI